MNFLKKLFFTIWYWRTPPWDTNQTPPELFDFITSHDPGRALDLGCGTGTNVITLAKHDWRVTGIDFIPRAIRSARRKTALAHVEADLRIGDVTKLDDIQGPFDLILDIGCYHSLSPLGMQAYRQNIRRLLSPGGSFLLYLFFKTEAGSGTGATETDLLPFSEFLSITERQDGTDRETRKSSWLFYEKAKS
jgi:cyclopropane fatty-acyl-phospholipid synthase-like methyltransferase